MRPATLAYDRSTGWMPGLLDELPETSDVGTVAFDYGSVSASSENDDELFELRSFSRRDNSRLNRRTFIDDFVKIEDDLEVLMTTFSVSSEDTVGGVDYAIIAPRHSELDEMLSIVRAFRNLKDGWDGTGSLAPSDELIEDALVVLQNWQSVGYVPEPEVSFDGNIVLELYDDVGFTLGGVELIGSHKALYSVNWRTEVLDKGGFDTRSQSEIISALSGFKALRDFESADVRG